MDMSTAFDTINRIILLYCLSYYYDITGPALKLIFISPKSFFYTFSQIIPND